MSREPSCTLPAPGFGAAQHVWLKALGLLPLRRRAAFQPEVAGTSVPQASASGNTAAVARLRVFVEGEAEPFSGSQAKLLRAVLTALGLSAEQVTFDSKPELPLLAFGRCPEPAMFRVAALSSLRDPIGKRVAWKELRRLRRALAESAR